MLHGLEDEKEMVDKPDISVPKTADCWFNLLWYFCSLVFWLNKKTVTETSFNILQS